MQKVFLRVVEPGILACLACLEPAAIRVPDRQVITVSRGVLKFLLFGFFAFAERRDEGGSVAEAGGYRQSSVQASKERRGTTVLRLLSAMLRVCETLAAHSTCHV